MITVAELIEVEKRFRRIEAVLDTLQPDWRTSKSDSAQLRDVRDLVDALGRRGVADMRAKFPGVTDVDWELALMGCGSSRTTG